MKTAVLALLRGYKRLLSPLLPPACRYVPSCSEYAEQAVEEHGVWKGGLMGLWRLLRCHPFATGGHDPVPRLTKNIAAECAAGNRDGALRMTPSNEASTVEFSVSSQRH